MKNIYLLIIYLLVIYSCENKLNQRDSNLDSTEKIEKINTNDTIKIIKQEIFNKKGEKLEMEFTMNLNPNEDFVIIKFKGETAKLKTQKAASGIWYKNDVYNLRGKGENIWFEKDGKIIFENQKNN